MATPGVYGFYATKADYQKAFNEARSWALESDDHRAVDAARIYHVNENSLTSAIRRIKQRARNSQGVYNRWGGNNKILDKAQEEAIQQYCYDQWEMGLGATHEMVKAAITYLRQVYSRILDILLILISIVSIPSS